MSNWRDETKQLQNNWNELKKALKESFEKKTKRDQNRHKSNIKLI